MGDPRTIRLAVVEHLKGNEALATYMSDENGTWFDFTAGGKFPLTITKSDCPAIIISPSTLTRRYATNVHEDLRMGLDFGVQVESADVGDCETLAEIIEDALRSGEPDFGLTGADAPYLAEFEGGRFSLLAEADRDNAIRGVYWGYEVTYSLTVRRTL